MITRAKLDDFGFRDDGNLCSGTAIITFPCWTSRGCRETLWVSYYGHQGEFSVARPGRAGAFQNLTGNLPLPRSRREIQAAIAANVARGGSLRWCNLGQDQEPGYQFYVELVTELIWRALTRLAKESK